MDTNTILLIIALVFGFYMAWNIGANDVANAMGTSVGSGALTLKRAVILAAILEFSGAFFVGTHVSETVRKGILNTEIFSPEPMFLVYGMMSALLAAGIWLQIASYFGLPVSTTHSIVGSIIGFGLVIGGVEAVRWMKVASIVSSWIISPVLSGIIAYFIFSILRKKIFHSQQPVEAAKRITPFLVFFVFFILALVMVFKGLKNLNLNLGLGPALIVAIIAGFLGFIISYFLLKLLKSDELSLDSQSQPKDIKESKTPEAFVSRLDKATKHLLKAKDFSEGETKMQISKITTDLMTLSHKIGHHTKKQESRAEIQKVEKIFVYLQILSACFVAFAHGANDVANAIGPLSAVVSILREGVIQAKSQVPLWVLALGGIGIVIGLATWGWRVIETIGRKITELTPSRGFTAEFAAATTIVFASKLGLPISTTHTLVGAVLGVGLARGIGALNLNTIRDIVLSWIITIPAGAFLAIIFFYIFRAVV